MIFGRMRRTITRRYKLIVPLSIIAPVLAGSLGALSLSSSLLLKEFGFAFFFSILVDAMVMRTYVVPAVMSLMGRWNWYAPGRIQRVKMK